MNSTFCMFLGFIKAACACFTSDKLVMPLMNVLLRMITSEDRKELIQDFILDVLARLLQSSHLNRISGRTNSAAGHAS